MSDKDPKNTDDLKKTLEDNLKKFHQRTGKGTDSDSESSRDQNSNSSNSSNSDRNQSNRNDDNRKQTNLEDELKAKFDSFKNKFFNNNSNKSSNSNNSSSNRSSNQTSTNFKAPKGLGLGLGLGVALVLGAIIGFKGFYTVNESERGVVTLLGAYHETTNPGLNWKVPFVEDVKIVNVQQVQQLHIGGIVLTSDANLVNVSMNIQYRIANPVNYLFNVESPIPTLEKASEAALRYTIGHMDMNAVLTTGRSLVRTDTLKNLESTLKRYNMGIEIVDVNFQYARPPEQVKAAFDDAIKAQEDEERFKREASAYQLAQLPIASGHAQQITNQAKAYAQEEVYKAQGAQLEFNQLLPQYLAQPLIFKQRYFLNTMASILKNTPKIIVEKGVNLNFLSLDSLFQQGLQGSSNAGASDNGKLLKLNQSTKTSGVPYTRNLNSSNLDKVSSVSSSNYSNYNNYNSNTDTDTNSSNSSNNSDSTPASSYSNDSYSSDSSDSYSNSSSKTAPSRFNTTNYSNRGGN